MQTGGWEHTFVRYEKWSSL